MKSATCVLGFLFVVLSSCHNQEKETTSVHNFPSDTTSSAAVNHVPANSNGQSISADYLIIPGESIRNTALNEDGETLIKRLGKPDFSDAAMGKAWMIWMGKKRDEHNNRSELDVYTTYKDSTMMAKVIKEIRTTSAAFKVNDSVHVYADLSTIQRYFTHLKYTRKYRDGSREVSIFDDVNNGIAFDIAQAGNQKICIGIIVHERGKSVNDIYINLDFPNRSN